MTFSETPWFPTATFPTKSHSKKKSSSKVLSIDCYAIDSDYRLIDVAFGNPFLFVLFDDENYYTFKGNF